MIFFLRRVFRRVSAVFRKRRFNADMNEELRSHIELRTEAHIRAGMQPEEARRTAAREFGWTESIKETCRDQRGIRCWEDFGQDLRFGFRMLGKSPVFASIAVISLGLGIAANTAIFSFVNTLLFRPAPIESPGELWQVWQHNTKGKSAFQSYYGLSHPGYTYFRNHNQSFVTLGAFHPDTPFVSWDRDGVGQSIQCQFASGDFFDICGIKMSLGRGFLPEEDRTPGAYPVVVVSHSFWRNSLGADPSIVGRMLILNGISLSIIGVAPSGFTGLVAGLAPDVWAAFAMSPALTHDPACLTYPYAYSLFGVGRLKPGVTPERAQTELTTLLKQYEQTNGKNNSELNAAVFPSTMVPGPFRGYVRAFTAILMAAVGLVLMIACANAANLMLARAVARSHEMAVRASIGASRPRLIKQLLTESVLLSLLAGAVGLLLTKITLPMLLNLTPPTLPIRPEVPIDGRVLLFTTIVSLLTGTIFGLAPAWRGSRVNFAASLKDGRVGNSLHKTRLTSVLVIGQVAVCLVLLIVGGLCLRSLSNAQNIKPGFKLENRVTCEVNLKDYGYSAEDVERFNERFLEQAATLPGIRSVAFANYLPLDTRSLVLRLNVEGHESSQDQSGFNCQIFDIGPGYFNTMGSTLLQGRDFHDRDRAEATRVAIINHTLAERYWPGQNPVGKRLVDKGKNGSTYYEIVGVVENGKYQTLGEEPRSVLYRPRLQAPGSRSTFVAYTIGDPRATLADLKTTVQAIDPRLSLARAGTLEEHLALALFPARTTGVLFGVFGVVALLLAISGLFGVVSYSVSQRTREFGIRMALGAQPAAVAKLVLRQVVILAGVGISIGLVGAFGLTRALGNLLYGISATDPLTFVSIALLLLAVALLACWLPTWRAIKTAPSVALRHE